MSQNKMKFRTYLNYATILIFIGILSALFSCKIHQKDQNRLVGLWKLEIIETKDSVSGDWVTYRDGLQGYLVYNEIGHSAVHLTTKGYEKANLEFENFNPDASLEELSHLANSYNYIAKYEILEDKSQIRHERLSHSNPNEWNDIVYRRYTLSGDTLFMYPIEDRNRDLRVTWVREN